MKDIDIWGGPTKHSHSPIALITHFEGDIRDLFRPVEEKVLPVLPVRDKVLFPGIVSTICIARPSSFQLVKQVEKKGGIMAIGFQRDEKEDEPTLADLYSIGVAARVVDVIDMSPLPSTVVIQTLGRVAFEKCSRQRPYLRAYIKNLPEVLPEKDDEEMEVLFQTCTERTLTYIKGSEELGKEAAIALQNINDPIMRVNHICANIPFKKEEKIALLKEEDVKVRAFSLLSILQREIKLLSLKHNITKRTQMDLDQKQREYFVQQQIKNLQAELGETEANDIQHLREKAQALNLPEKAAEHFERCLKKLERLNAQMPDYNVELNYLQAFVSLPWGKQTPDRLDIRQAERVLNADHYGMEKVKERILEQLAVFQLREGVKAPILCLYGPPGVGKTSLGRSIANALGRKYVRVSLGGINDESEIRGHRRTYVGAMPGRIVKGLQRAGSDNPVFILDEIDKVTGSNVNGDPQSALLEVLDPEQNKTFHDNYLDVDYDLSNVFFIATANSLQTIPAPLLDRMELIPVEGYSAEEKREIARRHLVPRLIKEINFKAEDKIKFASKALDTIINKYTRESGVRQLEKQLQKVFRKIALRTVENGEMPFRGTPIKPTDVETLLGNPPYSHDHYQGNKYAGVVTGLAWTAVGGEILFIETSLSRSKTPTLTLTGNLGEVMKESAILALSFIRSHAGMLGLDSRIFEQWGVHVHVPEGATPKDGPSAGITIATSLASALTQRKVRPHTAMTGEITLRGKVLPVGGIKEKMLAAARAGITDIIISEENRRDVEEIPERYRKTLTFHYVENVGEVFDLALLKEQVDHPLNLTLSEKEAKA